jgi:hypothetical protein
MKGMFTVSYRGSFEGETTEYYMISYYNARGEIGQCAHCKAEDLGSHVLCLINADRRLVSESELRDFQEKERFAYRVAGAVRIGLSLLNDGVSAEDTVSKLRASLLPEVCAAALAELNLD